MGNSSSTPPIEPRTSCDIMRGCGHDGVRECDHLDVPCDVRLSLEYSIDTLLIDMIGREVNTLIIMTRLDRERERESERERERVRERESERERCDSN